MEICLLVASAETNSHLHFYKILKNLGAGRGLVLWLLQPAKKTTCKNLDVKSIHHIHQTKMKNRSLEYTLRIDLL